MRSIVIATPPPAPRPRGPRETTDEKPSRAPPPERSEGLPHSPFSQRESASVLSLSTDVAPSPSDSSLVILRKTRSFCLSAPNRSGSTLSEKPVVISRPDSAPLT